MQFDSYIIRKLTTEDLNTFFELVQRNRQRLENFFTGTVSKTKTLVDTKDFLEDVTQRAKDRTYFPYIIVDTSTNSFAGFLDLKNIDWTIPKAELGCYIDAEYEGKGITTKAFSIFCDYCFKEYNFRKLFLRTHHSNKSAQRVAEKCGFEIEGIIRSDYKTTSGDLVDLIYYGRIN